MGNRGCENKLNGKHIGRQLRFTIVGALIGLLVLSSLPIDPDGPWGLESANDGNISFTAGPMNTDPPIKIRHDPDLVYQVGLYGWPGDGTVLNPYVISGYRINGSKQNHCINVADISAHLVIRDNILFGTSWDEVTSRPGPISAIKLWLVHHVTVEDNVISDQVGDTYGMHISDCNATVMNNSLSNLTVGIDSRDSELRVLNNTLEVDMLGINLNNRDDVLVSGNRIIQNSTGSLNHGMMIDYSDTIVVVDNEIVGFDYGINIDYATVDVRSNTFSDCQRGLDMVDSKFVNVLDNIFNCSLEGVRMKRCIGINFSRNSFLGCGIHFHHEDYWESVDSHSIDQTNTVDGLPILVLTFDDNITLDERYGQVILSYCTNVSLKDIVLTSSFIGLHTGNTSFVTVSNVTWRAPVERQFYAWSGTDWSIDNCTLDNVDIVASEYGYGNLKYWNITDNTMVNGTVDIDRIRNSMVLNNVIKNAAMWGIECTSSRYNIIDNNVVSLTNPSPGVAGISVSGSRTTRIANNTLSRAGFLLRWSFGQVMDYDFHDNTLNGRPVLLRVGTSGDMISGDYSQVILDFCTNVNIDGLEMYNSTIGIISRWCQDVFINGSSFEDMAHYGVYCYNSDDLTIVNSTFIDCWTAIYSGGVEIVLIEGNWIDGCTYTSIYITGDFVVVRNNVILNGGRYGIYFSCREACSIVRNYIGNCTRWALYSFYPSEVNHNTIVDNALDPDAQATAGDGQAYDTKGTGSWDDGFEGNYWSDYTRRYPSAGNDGSTWYTPYEVLSGDNQPADNHPLVSPPVDPISPTARAGPNITVYEGEAFELNGSLSWDNIGIVSYTWTLQRGTETITTVDGEVVEALIVEHGDYRYDLRVTDANGNFHVDTLFVTVLENAPPMAVAGDDIEVDQGTNVTFDGSRSSDEMGIASWVWTFVYGDENVTLTGAMVNFTFDLPGEYVINLTVTDVFDKPGYDLVTVTVLDKVPPVPVTIEEIEAHVGDVVLFDAHLSTDNVGIVSYEWALVYNGTTHYLSGPITKFTFNIPERYDVVLTLSDADGNSAHATVHVTVIDPSPPWFIPDWGVDQVMVETLDITVDFNWTPWSDDDASFPEGANFSYAFLKGGMTYVGYGAFATIALPDGGDYYVIFTAIDASGNEANHTFSLRVEWFPQNVMPPSVDAGPDQVLDYSVTIELRGTYSPGDLDIAAVWWESFDETQFFNESDLDITLLKLGDYEFMFIVEDWMGNRATDSLIVSIRPRMPRVRIHTDLDVILTKDGVIRGNATGDVDIIEVEYRIDGGGWTLADGGDNWSISLTTASVSDGEHTLEVRAWDGHRHGEMGPVTFRVESPKEPPDNGGKEDDGATLWPYIAVAIIAAILVLLVIFRLRGRGEG